jgi:hypothetical protein
MMEKLRGSRGKGGKDMEGAFVISRGLWLREDHSAAQRTVTGSAALIPGMC